MDLFHSLGDPGQLWSLASTGDHDQGAIMRAASLAAHRRLERIAASRALQGLKLRIHVEWDAPAYAAIVRCALRTGADLVVTETHGQGRAARWLFGSVDWELVRACPSPLLIVRSAGRQHGRNVLAALDPMHAHDKPAQLDREILRRSRELAALHGGSVHAAHVWLPLALVLPTATPAIGEALYLPVETSRAYSQAITRRFEQVTRSARLAPRQRHLVCGAVEMELPAIVRRARAATVVMGAVSRSGLRNLVIGHTAQRLIDRLPADILVVKPERFRTHVSRRRLTPSRPFPLTPR